MWVVELALAALVPPLEVLGDDLAAALLDILVMVVLAVLVPLLAVLALVAVVVGAHNKVAAAVLVAALAFLVKVQTVRHLVQRRQQKMAVAGLAVRLVLLLMHVLVLQAAHMAVAVAAVFILLRVWLAVPAAAALFALFGPALRAAFRQLVQVTNNEPLY